MKNTITVKVAESAVIHEGTQHEPGATFECSPNYARSFGKLLIVLPPEPEAVAPEPEAKPAKKTTPKA